MALFAALLLVLQGTTALLYTEAPQTLTPALAVPAELALYLSDASLVLFFVFPDGRFVPRWTRAPVFVWTVGLLVALITTGDSLVAPESDVVAGLLLGGLVAGIFAQLYRYAWVSTPAQRQQTKWVVCGVTATVVAQLVVASFTPPPVRPGIPALLFDLADHTGLVLAYLLIPLTITIAALRYRLWDIDPIVNRALVYGALTFCVVGLYVPVVGGLGTLLEAQGSLLISLFATGLVAIIFAPLRDYLQHGANRLMYGERDDPYGVVSRLGRRLEETLVPEAVLPTIVENVARALRLPRVAIWLADGETLRLGAAHGGTPASSTIRDTDAVETLRHATDGLGPEDLDPSGEYGAVFARYGASLTLPLVHRGDFVGALSLAPRGPGEAFSPADRRLLRDLAAQSGAAVHAVQLTVELRSSLEELRRSRERLVAAQEEERRRIQRDLHYGLGPTLASMRLRLEACLEQTQGNGRRRWSGTSSGSTS